MATCLKADVQDFESIWGLIQESGDQTDRWVSKEDLKVLAFGEKDEQLCDYFVAKNEGRVVAVAAIFYLYSTWVGKAICADEFLTNSGEEAQDAVLKELFKTVLERDCHRLRLTLNRSDTALLQRYAEWGGKIETEWLTVRLPKNGLDQFAKEASKLNKHYHIRLATKDDVQSILYLIQCLAEYENDPNAVQTDEEILKEDGYGKESYYQCFVAETDLLDEKVVQTGTLSAKMIHNPRIIGFALHHIMYCKKKGKVMHLEDLFVRQEHRKRGVGTELMRECAKAGVLLGCKEMDWQVLDWNTKAIQLYERLGGVLDKKSIFVQFKEDCMRNILQ
ncbi:PREDICTED: uncharacterized protein LOC105315946 [Amphimedon queenslandica]|uniref:N-acetyltransferase domain-containing protein n=1 Tax=Amphimedon queenslandica TaxID=400682 RepID=A0A1X7VNJ6_AMPQE|nr:PREDICTED: uncharacterized protein LOC105315946 [Amphimedon queenslandica]|eukprot:XP_019859276.1 PREDICTED: uncharacterized protein LOC105315946 [Amphimedon queenslandica]